MHNTVRWPGRWTRCARASRFGRVTGQAYLHTSGDDARIDAEPISEHFDGGEKLVPHHPPQEAGFRAVPQIHAECGSNRGREWGLWRDENIKAGYEMLCDGVARLKRALASGQLGLIMGKASCWRGKSWGHLEITTALRAHAPSCGRRGYRKLAFDQREDLVYYQSPAEETEQVRTTLSPIFPRTSLDHTSIYTTEAWLGEHANYNQQNSLQSGSKSSNRKHKREAAFKHGYEDRLNLKLVVRSTASTPRLYPPVSASLASLEWSALAGQPTAKPFCLDRPLSHACLGATCCVSSFPASFSASAPPGARERKNSVLGAEPLRCRSLSSSDSLST